MWPISMTGASQIRPLKIVFAKGKWTSHRILVLNSQVNSNLNLDALSEYEKLEEDGAVRQRPLSFESQGCFLTKYKSEFGGDREKEKRAWTVSAVEERRLAQYEDKSGAGGDESLLELFPQLYMEELWQR